MKLKSLIITSALLLAACGYTQAQSTQVIAHRGFWKTDGSAQNSIAALVKADSINCYGSEFDVWLTADNYNPQIEMFAHFKTKSSFHKTKCIN